MVRFFKNLQKLDHSIRFYILRDCYETTNNNDNNNTRVLIFKRTEELFILENESIISLETRSAELQVIVRR